VGDSTATERTIEPVWYTVAEVAVMLRYGLTKTKHLVLSGQIRSIKDGGSRRILPEYVAEYVARKRAQEDDG
jgi:excisionase family DNA binding protein